MFTISHKRATQGFSLIEILGALVILSIIVVAVVPSYMGSLQSSSNEEAISRAKLLDLAKTQYQTKHSEAASFEWLKAKDDSARYEFLKPYLFSPDDTFPHYIPVGYAFKLNGLHQATTVWKGDRIIYGEVEEEK